jgi:hypothetical protein
MDLAENVYSAYLIEKKDKRTWETKFEMIVALGLLNYTPALQEIEEIVKINIPHDMITYAAAQTYVRLKRKSINDARPVIELVEFGSISIIKGATIVLAYDKMIPKQKEILKLIALCWNLHKHKDRVGFEYGITDPRYGMAVACAGWDKVLTTDFLLHCISTASNDTALINAAKKSLKEEYTKLP